MDTSRFTTISLADLNSAAEMLRRRDNKYVVEHATLQKAMERFAQSFDILEIDGIREFTYDTRYFDSQDHGCYYDHHRGKRRRCKVRIRNYLDAGLCYVEIKLKDKRGETIKKRLSYNPALARTLDDRAEDFVRTSFRALYNKEFPYNLGPALDMRYKRMTLVAKVGGERMTIDNGIRFTRGNTVRDIDQGYFVVETKSSNGNGIADKVLRSLHRHPSNRCSKYCTGAALTIPSLKFNNFRGVLRKLAILPEVIAASPIAA